MNDKKVSMIVFIFVFVVAMFSIVFLFSEISSTGKTVHSYQKSYEYGLNGDNSQIDKKPGYINKQTFTGEKRRGCPAGFVEITSAQKAQRYEFMGRKIYKMEDVYCWDNSNWFS